MSGGDLARLVASAALVAACAGPGAGRSERVDVGAVARGPASSAPAASEGARPQAAPPVAKIRATGGGVCAVTSGTLACATKDDPTLRQEDFAVVDFAGSLDHTCVVVPGGRVRCRGRNARGELGAGLEEGRSDDWVDVKDVEDAARIDAAEGLTCVLTTAGAVRCWGNNDVGQTGGPDHYLPALRSSVRATTVPLPRPMRGIAVASHRACAHDDTRVFCWGASEAPREWPVPAPPAALFEAQNRLFVVTRDGVVSALAEGASRPIDALRGAQSFAGASNGVLCGVTPEGKLLCDGDRRRYDDAPGQGWVVQAFASVPDKRAIAVWGDEIFVLTADGSVFVTGSNAHHGALGIVARGHDEPVRLGNVRDAPRAR